jgi:hypothetical protein
MSASPIGMRYSSSGTSPFTEYMTSLSKKMTGLSSRIADLSRPLASYGVATEITFTPGKPQ